MSDGKGPSFRSLGAETKLPFRGDGPSIPVIVWQRSQVTPERLGSVGIAPVKWPRLNAQATGAWHAVQARASSTSSGSRLARGSSSSKYCAWKSGFLKELSWCDAACCSYVRAWHPAHVWLGQ